MNKRILSTFSEDMDKIGLGRHVGEMMSLIESSQTDVFGNPFESVDTEYSVPSASEFVDLYESAGKVHATQGRSTVFIPGNDELERIINLPFGNMDESHVDSLIELYRGLCEAHEVISAPSAELAKDVTDAYVSLFEAAYDTLAVIFEDPSGDDEKLRFNEDRELFEMSSDLLQEATYRRLQCFAKKCTIAKQVRRSPSVRKAAARMKRKWRKSGGKAIDKIAARSPSRKKAAAKRKAYMSGKQGKKLMALRSRGSKEESVEFEVDTISEDVRESIIGAIESAYERISEIIDDDDVSESLNLAMVALLTLDESDDEDSFMESIKPHLKAIQMALKHIGEQGK